jgi:hypothetical protein
MPRFTISIDVNEKPELGEHQEPEAYWVKVDELLEALEKAGIKHASGWSSVDDVENRG